MSLNITSKFGEQLIIAADGRGVCGDENIIVENSLCKLFVIDNRVIFIHGIYKTNKDVIDILHKNDNSDETFVTQTCRQVLNDHRNAREVKRWIDAFNNNELDLPAIPICLSIYDYNKSDNNFYLTSFSMENDFEPERIKLTSGTTAFRGWELEKARQCFRTQGTTFGSYGFMNNVLKTYRTLESKYIEVGGDITFIMLQSDGVIKKCVIPSKEPIPDVYSYPNLMETHAYGKNGVVILDQDGMMQTDTLQEADNVDSTHPLKLKFYIDDGVMSVAQVKLSFSLERFRAYSKGAASQTINLYSTQSEQINLYTTEESRYISTSTEPVNVSGGTETEGAYWGSGGHNHGIREETRLAVHSSSPHNAGSWVTWVPSGSHSHPIRLQSHTHRFEIPAHSHSISMPSHSHQISMPPHSHDIVYGIYEGSTASGVQVIIDGVMRDGTRYYGDTNLDITQWIQTPGWHTVELTSSQLGRINASIFTKAFVGM